MAAPYIPYDGPIVTRAEAMGAGLRRFFIGKPCEKRGHISERGLNGSCIACKRVYDAELYVKDGTAKRAASNKRRLENPEAIRAAKAAYYRENAELHNARSKAYRAANKDVRVASSRRYYLANRERLLLQAKAWAAAHPEAALIHARTRKLNRRAREAAATGSATHDEIQAMLKRQKFKCASCGASIKTKRHIDHIMPLALGGSGSIHNLQALCPSCNWSKGARCPISWAQSRGRLL